MTSLRIPLILGSALGVLVVAATAEATHKNWQLKNSGSQCFFTSYSASEPPWGSMRIENIASSARYAVCPVNLAGRWGSSAGPVVPVPRWANAMSAKAIIANNNTNGSVFDCYLRARLSTESIYYSSGASTTTTGSKWLTVASNSQWGGTLEAAESNTLRSMDFDCRIPGVPMNGSPSYIEAYQVKICQQITGCNDFSPPNHEGIPSGGTGFDGQYNFVQTSGFECTVSDYHEANNLRRSYAGITNNATYGIGVFCPITQPSDDSYYHAERRVEETLVHYSGGSFPPGCYLQATNYSSTFFPLGFYGSNEFIVAASGTVSQSPASAMIGPDLSLGVWCNLQAGQTLKGVTARLSETLISGGT